MQREGNDNNSRLWGVFKSILALAAISSTNQAAAAQTIKQPEPDIYPYIWGPFGLSCGKLPNKASHCALVLTTLNFDNVIPSETRCPDADSYNGPGPFIKFTRYDPHTKKGFIPMSNKTEVAEYCKGDLVFSPSDTDNNVLNGAETKTGCLAIAATIPAIYPNVFWNPRGDCRTHSIGAWSGLVVCAVFIGYGSYKSYDNKKVCSRIRKQLGNCVVSSLAYFAPKEKVDTAGVSLLPVEPINNTYGSSV